MAADGVRPGLGCILQSFFFFFFFKLRIRVSASGQSEAESPGILLYLPKIPMEKSPWRQQLLYRPNQLSGKT